MLDKELNKYCADIKPPSTPHNKENHYEVLDIGILSKYKFAYRNMCIPTDHLNSIPMVTTAKATIIPDNSAKVYGTITRVSPELFNLIVTKEGVRDSHKKSHYKMKTLKVRSATQNKTYTATTFIMINPVTPTKTHTHTPTNICHYKLSKQPTVEYRKKIVNAAKWYRFPAQYINDYLIKHN
tara:strand:- start:2704 stop:3249 length:546 start_codon:yes stop_codon:yes gene_type:complete